MSVTPCVGVWIEMCSLHVPGCNSRVTPCVGVWIEINFISQKSGITAGHSLRGSVD